MSNKRIEINPALFSLNGKNKTKKNKERPSKPIITTIISPNVLKNKLLKRIKEHKSRENNNNNTSKIEEASTNEKTEHYNDNDKNNTDNKINIDNNVLKFSEEFNDSINYLQSLSKEKKINDEKNLYEKQKMKRREELQRSTLKNYSSGPFVYNDLPDDLKEPLITVNTETLRSDVNESPLRLKYKVDSIVPYGVLKGGFKPTMREWNKTQKNRDFIYGNNIHNNNNTTIATISTNSSDRENKLNALKDKIKEKQKEEYNKLQLQNAINNSNKVHVPIPIPNNNTNTNNNNTNNNNNSVLEKPLIVSNENIPSVNNNNNNIVSTPQPKIMKQIHKKTIRRKYTLGKSKIKKTVGILLKNKTTRKNVLIAQKELKEKPISDVKKYLRTHNLIKTGSNAPNDVLRKLYESAMLTGEVNNNNKDIMLHNFMKDDKTNDDI